MHPTVILREPGRVPLRFLVDGPIEIGRECAGVLVNDPLASRRHLRLDVEGGAVTVTDLGSTNGTCVDDEPLSGTRRLTQGMTVKLGTTTICLAPADDDRAAASAAGETAISRVARTVIEVRPDLRAVAADATTVAIVFTDIERSTQRAVELGDDRWFDLLAAHNSIVRETVLRHGGTEISSQGDGFMLTFSSARSAVLCMMETQRRLSDHGQMHPEHAIHVRMGGHVGEVIERGGVLIGRHIHQAARIGDAAGGDEILVSSLVRDLVAPRGDIAFGVQRVVTLKGLPGRHELHAVEWK